MADGPDQRRNVALIDRPLVSDQICRPTPAIEVHLPVTTIAISDHSGVPPVGALSKSLSRARARAPPEAKDKRLIRVGAYWLHHDCSLTLRGGFSASAR